MRTDLSAAIRSLLAGRAATLVALCVLALGIGATTAIYSVVDAVVLRALPFDEHDRLVAVGTRRPPPPEFDPARDPAQLTTAAPQDFMDWDGRQTVMEDLATYAGGAMAMEAPGGEVEDIAVLRVTADLFPVLRIRPVLGRTFDASEEVDGRHRVAVLSHWAWDRYFASDAGVLGQTLVLNGDAYDIVGVLPEEVTYPVGASRATGVYVPYVIPPDERTRKAGWHGFYLHSVGRLKPGVSIAEADAHMAQIGRALQAEHPEWNKDTSVVVRPLHDHIVGTRVRTWMLMLLGAVSLVLLIACVNVATLQLARAASRERDLALRAALGASRGRLVRQLLGESLVLASGGAVLGLLLAWWGVDVLRLAMPDGVPRVAAIAVNLRVLAAAVTLAVGTGVVFGLAPAWQLSKPEVVPALQESTRTTAGRGRRRWSGVLVVAEVALAMVLLVGAALFIGSFRTLMAIDPGFRPSGVLTARVMPPSSPGEAAPDHGPRLLAIVDRVAQIPGVTRAAVISGGMPFGGSMTTTTVQVPSRGPESISPVSLRHVSDGYHQAMGIALRGGRFFSADDRSGSAPVVLISEALAALAFPDGNAVGQSLTTNHVSRTVVGVVGDVRQVSLESDALPEVYVPLTQEGHPWGELIVQMSGAPGTIVPGVRQAVAAEFPSVPLRNVRTLDEVFAGRVAQRRFNMLMLGLFGVLGLTMAAVGLYGVLAHGVEQRTREIRVRMALGATASSVLRLVLARVAWWMAAGLALGGAASWMLRTLVEAHLFGVTAADPRAMAVAALVLSAAAMAAGVMPARRAIGVNPLDALRQE